MKNLSIIASILLLTSCATEKNIIPKEELLNWSSRNDTLFFKSSPAAVFTGFEMEIYKGEMTREICIEQINDDVPIDSIVLYVHTLHFNDRVQVVSTYGKDKTKNKR